jgi:hypothetical protein
MKGWHIGMIAMLLVAYLIGAKFPSFGTSVLNKVGL